VALSCSPRVDLRLAARPQSIAALRRAVVDFARSHGVSALVCDDVALAVSEALSNVVLHAYADRAEPGDVRARTWMQGDALHVAICDEGTGMVPRTDSPGLGLGLAIMGRLASHVRIESREDMPGLRVHMTFAL
jgi:anti-sigma regulatory factor (Ser/Thr protein kinase)